METQGFDLFTSYTGMGNQQVQFNVLQANRRCKGMVLATFLLLDCTDRPDAVGNPVVMFRSLTCLPPLGTRMSPHCRSTYLAPAHT